MNKYLKTIGLLAYFSLLGCTQMSKKLETELIPDGICVYTQDHSMNGVSNSYLYMGKIDSGKPFRTSYEMSYEKMKFPIKKSDCLLIPKENFELNTGYLITLDTSTIYKNRICLSKRGNNLRLIELKDGIENCN